MNGIVGKCHYTEVFKPPLGSHCMQNKLSHLDSFGAAHMVDVGGKNRTSRLAIAEGSVTMQRETLAMILAGNHKKGDVIRTAHIAAIMAAKRTYELIPLCHPLNLDAIDVNIVSDDALPGLRITATVKVTGKTGVEMEALTAISVACLTIYDMAKAVDRTMKISNIHLIEKSGGQSGRWSIANALPMPKTSQ